MKSETVYSKGYPTPVIYRQRSNLTFAIEWTGENLDPHIRDFIAVRCAPHIKDRIELFVTKRDALIVFRGDRRPQVIAKGDFLVDQYQAHTANEMGWVVAEPARFWHLYQEEPPQGVVAQVPGIEQAQGPDAGSSPVNSA